MTWLDLTEHAELVRRVAATRNRDGSSAQVKLSEHYDLLGVIGELAVALASGLSLDETRTVHGDTEDFPDTDVKTTLAKTSRPLLRHPKSSRRWHPFYVLVAATVEPRIIARIVGYATDAELRAAPTRVFRKELGEQHYLGVGALHPGLPPHLYRCSLCKGELKPHEAFAVAMGQPCDACLRANAWPSGVAARIGS